MKRPLLWLLISRIALQYAEVQESNCAPAHYKRFLLELAKNTPICALLQFGWDSSVRGLLCGIAAARWDIADSRKRKEYSVLRNSYPAIVDMICGIRKVENTLSQEFRDVLADMIELVDITFDKASRGNSEYPGADTVPTQLSYFPQWPVVRGVANYIIPKRTPKDEVDLCLKHKHGHPVLSPGILTLYCKHSVCYGYTIMESYESVKIPFEVIMTRYPTAPKVVIYDFCCKLHVYFLKREPKFVESTVFIVDRFHWTNHKACSI
ncbi:MAG: hypothetical protein GY696_31245, partial [Gammaproteobacteria bacterium]|nr:hypothetical protein [Gammaproteobacteria bacterium]